LLGELSQILIVGINSVRIVDSGNGHG